MSDRREFLKDMAGAAPRRRQIVVGQRIKTIDVHAHCAVPEAAKSMNRNDRDVATKLIEIVDHVLNTPGLSDADKRAILGDNAGKLLRITT